MDDDVSPLLTPVVLAHELGHAIWWLGHPNETGEFWRGQVGASDVKNVMYSNASPDAKNWRYHQIKDMRQ
jgi:hypothetical protein